MTRAVNTAPADVAVSAATFARAMRARFGSGLVETDPAYALLEYRTTARYPWQVELADVAARAIASGDPSALDRLRLEVRAAIR